MAPPPSYHHRGGETPLIWSTIGDHLRAVVARHGGRPAVVSVPEGARLTYSELDRRIDELSRGLVALGIERGDRVGVWSTDNVAWVLLQMATARIGAVLVTINPASRTEELHHALALARVAALFLLPSLRSSDAAAMVLALCPEAARRDPDELSCALLPDLRRLVALDPGDPGDPRDPRDPGAPGAGTAPAPPARGFLRWAEVLARGAAIPADSLDGRAAALDPDDAVTIQFTSGTTGAPKAVVLTHHNMLNNAWFIGEAMGLDPDDRLCVPVPFHHCFGMVVSTLACLARGASIVIPAPRFDAGATLAAIERERCTALHGVPTMFIAELEHPERARFDLSSLRTGIMAGAPCPPELVQRVMRDLGAREILIAYGQTEASPVTHLTRPDDTLERRLSTVGRNLEHQEVKIVDPASGRVVPAGTPGEICFRGYHVMRGYFGQEQATREAIDEAGWLRSGDIGAMDDEGYLTITGRLRDMIIRGGENVYPAEIEAFYHGHPKVAEIAVFGVPDERLGEEVAAWVRLHAGASGTPEELRRYARGRIAHHKVPRHIWIVDEFPMTASGKIQKFLIRDVAAERLRWERERERAAAGAGARGGGSASARRRA